MLQRRAWGVETSTAQMEIIGRRHYGRKAVPAGGGGGRSDTRELLDTLLLWNPKVAARRQGPGGGDRAAQRCADQLSASSPWPMRRTGLFGTGQTTIRATQDLQIISGLPPLVREGDQFRAQLTLRNTTKAAMKVEVSAARDAARPRSRKPSTFRPAKRAKSPGTSTAPAQLGADARRRPSCGKSRPKTRSSGARDAPQGQPAHHARRAADGAAGHAGAGRWQLHPRRGPAGRRPARPRAA